MLFDDHVHVLQLVGRVDELSAEISNDEES